MAYDFIFAESNSPLIIEISYTFPHSSFYPGYWDSELVWHEDYNYTEYAILDDLLDKIHSSQAGING